MRDVLEIATERLSLRPVAMKDAPRIARFTNDRAVSRMLSHVPAPQLECAVEGWIMIVSARAGRDFVFAVELPGEGLIGAIGAHARDGGSYEVGYWIGRPFWGNGFASEALQGLVSQARALGPLQAGHFVDNPASGRVLEKGGFAYTGEVVDMFSLGRGARVACRRMAHQGAHARERARRAVVVH